MKKYLILLFLIVTLSFHAFAQGIYNAEKIFLVIDISSRAEIKKSGLGYVDEATINLTFFPKSEIGQEVTKFLTEPKAMQNNNVLQFAWNRPGNSLNFNVEAEVETTNYIIPIRTKIPFPIDNLAPEIIRYTKPSPTIDSDDEEIIKLASSIVQGEDDLYAAAFKIADWTKNNIKYNLSTLTADVSQKASWVLENKKGVCDELTSLFIALLRAVGIPAKFVSGVSYTSSEIFDENFGPHGWAEVYFPGYGWVPFDVTYGEFGWVDPTHIKFKESIDSDEPTTYYQWSGRNADIEAQKLKIKTTLLETQGRARNPISIKLNAYRDSIKSGSYNLIETTIENLNNYYYSTEIQISKPREVEILNGNSRSILLLPNERKKTFWIVKTGDLDERYVYTFPIVASTPNNISAEVKFKSSIKESFVSRDEVENIARQMQDEIEKEYSGIVEIDCKTAKKQYYEYENIEIDCTFKNTGNIFLEDVKLCIENCFESDIGISQSKNFVFRLSDKDIGNIKVPITAKSDIVTKTEFLDLTIKDKPDISIAEMEFPEIVSYNEKFNITITLAKNSVSNPRNVEVLLNREGYEKKWSLEEMKGDGKFVLESIGKNQKYGINNYDLNVKYEDDLGNEYNVADKFSINLGKANFFQRVLLWFNRF